MDLCILLGCDYLETVKGVGPKSAFKLIQEYKSIDNIVGENTKFCDKVKETFQSVENFMAKVNGARKIFLTENVLSEEDVKEYGEIISQKRVINSGAAVDYLVNEMQFDRRNAQMKLDKLKGAKATPKQMTLSGFIKVVK